MSRKHERDDSVRRAARARKRRRHRRIHRIKQLAFCTAMICMVCIGVTALVRVRKVDAEYVEEETEQKIQQKGAETKVQKINADREKVRDTEEVEETVELLVGGFEKSDEDLEKLEKCPEELQELLEKYPETYDYVIGYSERDKYKGKRIDLTEDVEEGEVPLLLQWDKRWGYDNYGDKLIGAAGCGPTCMSMAYIYLTGDTEKNPREMAEFEIGRAHV